MAYFEPENGVSNGLSQQELLDAIGLGDGTGKWGNPHIWGCVYSHRQACIRYLRDYVLWKVDEPRMTRSMLKRLVIAEAKRVEEWGPPGQPAV
jgi:hypothetical protein